MKVVLGTDGSENSRFAEDVIQRYPFGGDSEVLCCSAYSAARIITATSHPFLGPILAEQIGDAVEVAKESANRHAAESASRLKAAGLHAKGLLLEGDPADALASYAAKEGAAFVTVGSRGLGAIDTLLLGSVARDLANDKDVTLLVARRVASDKPGLRVAFATDHSEFANRVVDKLPSLVGGRFARFDVVSALDPDSRELRGLISKEMDVHKGLGEWLTEHTAAVSSRLASIGEGTHRILEGHAREELRKLTDYDLIIMGARGRSGLSRMLLGSVSHYVLTRATCSVMIVRA